MVSLYPCPRCGGPSTADGCPNCGRGFEPLIADLATADAAVLRAAARADELRAHLRTAEETRSMQLAKRARILARLAERERSLRALGRPAPRAAAPSPAPAPAPAEAYAAPAASVPAAAVPPAVPVRPYGHGPALPGEPRRAEASGKVVQNALLVLGAILAAAAAISFTTVAWVTFGTGGRAAILAVVTALALAAPAVLVRRGLRATAEAVAAVGLLLVVLDGAALWLLGLVPDVAGARFVAGSALVAAALGPPYHRLTRLAVPVYAVPVLGSAALVLVLTTRADTVAVLLLCAIALAAAVAAGRGTERIAKDLCGGLAAATVIAASVYLTAHHVPGLLALVPIAVTVAVTATARRLPGDTWRGPLAVGLAATAFSALVALWLLLHSLFSAFGVERPDAPAMPWQTPVVLALLTLGEVTAGRWRPPRWETAAAGTALAVLSAPGALALDRPYAVAGLLVLGTAGAYSARFGPIGPAAARLVGAVPLFLLALGLARSEPAAVAAACTVLAAAAVALASPGPGTRRVPFTAVALGALAWTVPGLCGAWFRLWESADGAAAAVLLAAGLVALTVSLWRPVTGGWAVAPVLGALLGLLFGSLAVGAEFARLGTELLALGGVLLAVFLLVLVVDTEPAASADARARTAAAGASTAYVIASATALVADVAGGGAVLTAVVLALAAAAIAPRLLSGRRGPAVAAGAYAAGSVAAAVAALAVVPLAVARIAATGPEPWTGGLLDRPDLGWRTPVVLILTCAAAMWTLRGRAREPVALTAGALAAVAAPVAWPVPWPGAPATALAVAVAAALWSAVPGRAWPGRAGTAVVLGAYAVVVCRWDATATAVAVAVLLAGCTATALLAVRLGNRLAAGAATTAALLLLPGSAWTAAVAFGAAPAVALAVATAGAGAGLAVTGGLRLAGASVLPSATAAVPVAAGLCALGSVWVESAPVRVYAGIAGLVAVAAALLHHPDRGRIGRRLISAVPALGAAAVLSGAVAVAPLILPYTWLTAVWSRVPTSTVDGLRPAGAAPPGDLLDLAVLAAVALACVLAALTVAGRRRAVAIAVAVSAAVLAAAPVALDLPWPAGPVVLAAVTAGAALVTARAGDSPAGVTAAVTAVVAGAAAVAWSLASPGTTVGVAAALSATAYAVALLGGGTGRRVAGRLAGGVGLAGTVIAGGRALDLPAAHLAAAGTAVVLVLFGVARATALFRGRAPESVAAEGVAHAAVVPALAFAAASGGLTTAAVLAVHGAMLGVYGLSLPRTPRRVYAAAAVLAELIAYWILLASASVRTVEAYTLPVAVVALAGGALEWRRNPRLRSWTAVGAGLIAAFAPTLAPVLVSSGEPLRRLVLGVAAMAVLLAGAVLRWQAPVVVGGVVLVAVVLHELVLLWELLPAWLPIAVAAVVLLVAGATFEKRRAEVRRLRTAVRAMR